MLKPNNNNVIQSYIVLRRIIGILGISLPFLCLSIGLLFGNTKLQPSISLYYFTNSRDIVIGILFSVSFFLISYKGYDLIDNIITIIIGIAGMGIAVFPCLSNNSNSVSVGIFQLSQNVSNIFHLLFAGTFFILLSVNSLFLFTKTNNVNKSNKMKLYRNLLYKICGFIILIGIITTAGIYLITDISFINSSKVIFYIETIMLIAFGVSWLVKGETILMDKE